MTEQSPAQLRAQLFSKVAKVSKDIGHIAKQGENKHHGYKYQEYIKVVQAARDSMAQHQLWMHLSVDSADHQEYATGRGTQHYWVMRTTVSLTDLESGHVEQFTWFSESLDTGDKGLSKAMSFAHKYAMLKTFMIPDAESEDPDGASPETGVRAEPKAQARAQSVEAQAPVPGGRFATPQDAWDWWKDNGGTQPMWKTLGSKPYDKLGKLNAILKDNPNAMPEAIFQIAAKAVDVDHVNNDDHCFAFSDDM